MLVALAPSHPSFCLVRRLGSNKLGPEAGMALAEALKSNTALEWLKSAALAAIEPTPPCAASCLRVFHSLPRSLDVPLKSPRPRPHLGCDQPFFTSAPD